MNKKRYIEPQATLIEAIILHSLMEGSYNNWNDAKPGLFDEENIDDLNKDDADWGDVWE